MNGFKSFGGGGGGFVAFPGNGKPDLEGLQRILADMKKAKSAPEATESPGDEEAEEYNLGDLSGKSFSEILKELLMRS